MIKGNIGAGGERIYHVPGSPYYARTEIDESRGERWFCTVAEAVEAGWRPARGTPGTTSTATSVDALSPTPTPTAAATGTPSGTSTSPEVCEFSESEEPVIKGNIGAGGERIYHVPGSPYYTRTKIDESKGEVWFCTVAEAAQAGWRPARGTPGATSTATSADALSPTPTSTPAATGTPADTSTPSKTCEFSESDKPVIKGNIGAGGERIYHVPGSPYYTRTKIDESKGEVWFCTVAEAAQAGWRPARGTPGATSTATSADALSPTPTSTPAATGTPADTSTPSKTCEFSESDKPVIKGNIGAGGERIYHVPGSPYYTRTKIDESKGEVWFCTVAEAAQAGWRPARGTPGATSTATSTTTAVPTQSLTVTPTPSPTSVPAPSPTPTPTVTGTPFGTSGYPKVCEFSESEEPVIKGNIGAGGERIYHVPGSPYYARTEIDESKGERWFCTVADAAEAGWRPPDTPGAVPDRTVTPVAQPPSPVSTTPTLPVMASPTSKPAGRSPSPTPTFSPTPAVTPTLPITPAPPGAAAGPEPTATSTKTPTPAASALIKRPEAPVVVVAGPIPTTTGSSVATPSVPPSAGKDGGADQGWALPLAGWVGIAAAVALGLFLVYRGVSARR